MKQDQDAVIVPVEKINVGNRLRYDLGEVDELAESIAEYGLLQAIVIDHQFNLIAGGRRLTAVKKLEWETIPARFIECLDDAQLRRLEIEENIRRKEMSWQERVLGVYEVHMAKMNRDLTWTGKHTGELLGVSKAHVNNTLIVARELRNDANEKTSPLWKVASMSDALRLLLQRKEDEARALLATQTRVEKAKVKVKTYDPIDLDNVDLQKIGTVTGVVSDLTSLMGTRAPDTEMPDDLTYTEEEKEIPTIQLSKFLFHGDGVTTMESFDDHSIDAIISDLPYAIDMDHLSQSGTGMNVDRTAAEHDVDDNILLLRRLFAAAPAKLRQRGTMVFFHDIEHYALMSELAKAHGFVMQRWPLIWHKNYVCKNQAAAYNTTKNYEVAYIFRRPSGVLANNQPTSVWTGGYDFEDKIFTHPFAKPIGLWQWLFQIVLSKGMNFYDPCAGSGSSVYAGIISGYNPIANELKQEHYHELTHTTKLAYNKLLGEVRFTFEPNH